MEKVVYAAKHKKHIDWKRELKKLKGNWQLQLLILPAVIWLAIFCYYPMYGVLIAFKKFSLTKSIMEMDWVGLKYFDQFFSSPYFIQVLENTLKLSFFTLLFTFPLPIIFALLLNQFRMTKYKKFVQTVVYAPNFISVVIVVGMMTIFLSPHSGIVNNLIKTFGGKPISFTGEAGWFRPLFILSEIWQKTGFSAVVYLAALAGISPDLHEAARVDGANKWQRIKHIDIPSIMPTAMILLILSIGGIMTLGGDKAYLMKNDSNVETARTIIVHVTDMGIYRAQYSYAAAVGLFNSVVNVVLLLFANKISKKLTDTGLF